MRHLRLGSRSFKRLLSVSMGKRRSVEGSPEERGSPGQDEGKSMEPSQDEKPPQKPSWRCFSYEEIHKATDGFHQDNLVGRGGYAEVYRGLLEDGQVIAVKRLTRASTDEQKEKDFLQELGTIGHVRHPNVSSLLGCCIDRDLHLIFEFSSHGSVSSNLHDENSPPMAWKLRYNIAVGTARGLHYLHKGCQRRIIHRDIKASNILLTANFEPQISDFGLAKWLPSEWTHRAVAPIEGTFGCLAPEYFMHGVVDEKTDVFAFGVFLLEIISGRKPVDGSHRSLLSWAKPYLSDGTTQKLVDPRLEEDYDMGQLKRLTFIASLCIRATATWRPSMTEVLELLEDGEMLQQDRWKMPEEEEEEDEFLGFDDLDDEWDECDTPSSSSSTRSSQP
ncbi:probable receptor-like serine/threonine-protein kinase At5g57670 [Phoenix dactylifera]|uniref:Probable receptor-like serine/threonine-protein kinase At5g57670 n=1 Tax=Phoenix dactylifera TaxID=42345 RepID=A0A8B7CPK0_PHODC|nr:probable receptor-like serine/threonine-protein kinase At5g57670 [Phoenix dactylifera]